MYVHVYTCHVANSIISAFNSNFAILPANENNTFLIMDPTPILDTRDICNIRCYGDQQVGDDIDEACGAPIRRIERGTTEFDGYSVFSHGYLAI